MPPLEGGTEGGAGGAGGVGGAAGAAGVAGGAAGAYPKWAALEGSVFAQGVMSTPRATEADPKPVPVRHYLSAQNISKSRILARVLVRGVLVADGYVRIEPRPPSPVQAHISYSQPP